MDIHSTRVEYSILKSLVRFSCGSFNIYMYNNLIIFHTCFREIYEYSPLIPLYMVNMTLLYNVALCFQLLRQQGYNISCVSLMNIKYHLAKLTYNTMFV